MPELAHVVNEFDTSGLPNEWEARLKVIETYNPHRYSVYWEILDDAGKAFDVSTRYDMTMTPQHLVRHLQDDLNSLALGASNYVANRRVLGL